MEHARVVRLATAADRSLKKVNGGTFHNRIVFLAGGELTRVS